MTTYYVATLSTYALVEATNEDEARVRGEAALRKMLGPDRTIQIRTVREATDDEIELQRWHNENLAREGK